MDPKYQDIGRPLIRLIEECAEVIHIVCKIERFGLLNYHPSDPLQIKNRELLMEEIDDIKRVIDEVENTYRQPSGENPSERVDG